MPLSQAIFGLILCASMAYVGPHLADQAMKRPIEANIVVGSIMFVAGCFMGAIGIFGAFAFFVATMTIAFS
jgi:hypothetical protein